MSVAKIASGVKSKVSSIAKGISRRNPLARHTRSSARSDIDDQGISAPARVNPLARSSMQDAVNPLAPVNANRQAPLDGPYFDDDEDKDVADAPVNADRQAPLEGPYFDDDKDNAIEDLEGPYFDDDEDDAIEDQDAVNPPAPVNADRQAPFEELYFGNDEDNPEEDQAAPVNADRQAPIEELYFGRDEDNLAEDQGAANAPAPVADRQAPFEELYFGRDEDEAIENQDAVNPAAPVNADRQAPIEELYFGRDEDNPAEDQAAPVNADRQAPVEELYFGREEDDAIDDQPSVPVSGPAHEGAHAAVAPPSAPASEDYVPTVETGQGQKVTYAMNKEHQMVVVSEKDRWRTDLDPTLRRHHSSAYGGEPVLHAGHVAVGRNNEDRSDKNEGHTETKEYSEEADQRTLDDRGKITYLDDVSGHYKPDGEQTYEAFRHLDEQQVLGSDNFLGSRNVSQVDKSLGRVEAMRDNSTALNLSFSQYRQTHGNEQQARRKQALNAEIESKRGNAAIVEEADNGISPQEVKESPANESLPNTADSLATDTGEANLQQSPNAESESKQVRHDATPNLKPSAINPRGKMPLAIEKQKFTPEGQSVPLAHLQPQFVGEQFPKPTRAMRTKYFNDQERKDYGISMRPDKEGKNVIAYGKNVFRLNDGLGANPKKNQPNAPVPVPPVAANEAQAAQDPPVSVPQEEADTQQNPPVVEGEDGKRDEELYFI